MKKITIILLLISVNLTVSLNTYAQVVAAFTIGGNTNKCTNDNYSFTNTSQNAVSYEWHFGDGFTSTSVNPTHNYNYGGSFVVTLKAFDAQNNVSEKQIGVFVKNSVNPYFGWNTYGDIYPGDEIQFENYTTSAETFYWDFGDSQTSTNINPRHTYQSPGQKTVTLTAENGCGSPANFSAIIDVVDTNTVMPIANGGSSNQIFCPNQAVQFYSYSSRYKYLIWDFGDGNTIQTTQEDVYYAYPDTGNFTVKLFAYWDASRVDSTQFNVTVSTTQLDMPYSYVSPMNFVDGNYIISNCANSDFSLSAGLPDENSIGYWKKHDGTTITDIYGTVSYAVEGNYDLWYIVENSCGAKDSTYFQLWVLPSDTFPAVAPNIFTSPSNNICLGDIVEFHAGYYNEPNVTYQWYINQVHITDTFSFKHTFPAVIGNYEVKLIRIPQCGLIDSAITFINVNNNATPQANFYVNYSANAAACYLDSVRFNLMEAEINPNTHFWDFGDGHTSNQVNPVHVYSSPGYYTILHKATNSCNVSQTEANTVFLQDDIKPLPRFSAYPKISCVNEEILFDNFSIGADSAVLDYGDGHIETFKGGGFPHIFHSYENPGTYVATLHVFNRCSRDSGKVTLNIIPGPITEINGGNQQIKPGVTLTFTKNLVNAVYHIWYRSKNESDSTTADNLVMTFNDQGVFTIYLVAFNQAGCYTVDSVTITVSNLPDGISQQNSEIESLNVFPNPINNTVNFAINLTTTATVSVKIFDLRGKLVAEISPTVLFEGPNVLRKNMDDLPQGLYLCTITINDIKIHQKVVKQ